jgi:hypothetical protein
MQRIAYIIFLVLLIFGCRNSSKTDHVIITYSSKDIETDTVLKPILGNRLTIIGDFDGDGKEERLVERYISQITKRETNKAYENEIDYSELISLIADKHPMSFILSDNTKIDTLHISSNSQLFGIMFLKNEGDLNGDGSDELSYVVDYADISNLNRYHIITFKNRRWTELGSFPIWEWQISELKENQGLVKMLNSFEIECYFRNKEAVLDTMTLKLKEY